ncbi:FlgK family flagellar hook-associated protein [Jannaschia sp. LMIT008]|uniref:FlgK family flagellar hook-associated protein n=1 Tax=Jannaschia maritima TaxID=3032585 RepID=UPI002811F1AF|nr:flagellar basal body rod C-terminal domain-containing protein [Jannaschia sp. LMIT008]
MSLSLALTNAVNGLGIASKRAEVVATNVANAGRPGYARRSLDVTPISPHVPGSRTEVIRNENTVSTTLRRESEGREARADVKTGFWNRIDAALGEPGDPASLSGRLTALQGAVFDATTQPGSAQRLAAVSAAAEGVADGINAAAREVQDIRRETEVRIGREVASLNADLHSVVTLNQKIVQHAAVGGETATFEDQRTLVLDRIAQQVDITVLPRDFGAVAIVSKGGQILLDGSAKEVTFAQTADVTPDRTLGNGLKGLQVLGHDVSAQGGFGHVGGGRLEALFHVRDVATVDAQTQLDAFADELVGRFAVSQDPARGAPALFLDGRVPAGGAGLAGTLEVNAPYRGDSPGTHWKLRDGLVPTAPDPAAAPGNLETMLDAFTDLAAPQNATLGAAPRDLDGHAAALKSLFSHARGQASTDRDLSVAAANAARSRDAENDVDIDEEMRRLIEVEQSYAAAAKVVEAVDQMMDRLTRI